MHITFNLVVYTAKPIVVDTVMVKTVSLEPRETELSVVINSATWTRYYIDHFICSGSDQKFDLRFSVHFCHVYEHSDTRPVSVSGPS